MFNSELLFNTAFWFYLIAATLYIGFLIFNKREEIGQIATITTIGGLVVMTVGLIMRTKEAGHSPFSNLYESMIFFAWAVIVIYIIIEFLYNIKVVGAFIVPIGFLAIAFASMLPYRYQAIEPLVPALQSYWLEIHVITLFLAYAGFSISFGMSIMLLIKIKEEFTKKENFISRLLPDSYTLDNFSYKSTAISFPLLTFGIISGAIWANYAWGTYWSWDPKETWSLITWLIYAAYLHGRFTKGWRGKKAAYLSIIGFGAVIFTYLGVTFLLPGLHAYA
jgi:cytochrome c-type biogenesis protein CcsB